MIFRAVILTLLLLTQAESLSSFPSYTNLVQAIITEDGEQQLELIKSFADSANPFVQQTLTAWRGGLVYILEINEIRLPILLDVQTDSDGRSGAISVLDGLPLKDTDGTARLFDPLDLTPADTTSKLRKAIKTTLDIFSLSNTNPKMRRDAVIKLGQDQNPDYLPFLEARLVSEPSNEVKRAIKEAIALIQTTASEDAVRISAINRLAELRSINSISFLHNLRAESEASPEKYDEKTRSAIRSAIYQIENYMWWGNLFGTAFRGLSLAAVLLVAALGLAITFGLMGVINMAHGEVIMVGAYSAYVTQNVFRAFFGENSLGMEIYFVAAIIVSFLAAALLGLILERSIIRFLYKRPLESLLATWGVSLVLQQVFRHTFGAANVQVDSPSWLTGSLVIKDVLLAYNRIFVIFFAVFIVLMVYLLLTKTSLGLQIRAVMQNRTMASALGVQTSRVNMLTFALGSGLAGMAGACLSQIGNVGPSLGQNYIVDCFMVVVLGGVGSLVGTASAALGIGVTDQILQPWLGAVLGKITVLAAIILFLQWRPAGLFATRGRSLEG